jgi:two-component system osmolarity sensor histidine kinase EnvZ
VTLLKPRTLFGRTLNTIALVSIGFLLFMLVVIGSLMLIPLGQRSADDLAALMISSAEQWQAAGPGRPALRSMFVERYNITLSGDPAPLVASDSWLPYRFFLEQALSQRTGLSVRLLEERPLDLHGGNREQWFWVKLPVAGETVRVGFPRSRIGVRPPVALLLVLTVGIALTLVTAVLLVRRQTAPLESLSRAVRTLGRGEWPEPIAEHGPDELAELARSFNRMTGQVRELLANRTTLLAGISHDLRTPITQIRLALEMLPDQGGDAVLLAGIRRDLDRMNRLIGMFLDISRGLEGGESEPLLIEPLLEELVNRFRQQGLEIDWRPCPGCAQAADAMALTRIVSNLLENAQRYGAGTPVSVTCDCAAQGTTISITDHGPGVPEAELENVFRPFYRLEPSRNPVTGGSGLGLAIVRQLALAHGWDVALQGNPGGGTRAVLRLHRQGSHP